MLRRDYILRQIDEFVAAMMRLAGLTKAGEWDEASKVAGSQFQALAGADISELLRMSDTELVARLAEGHASYEIQERIAIAARLFKENGDIFRAGGKIEESHACYLKGLHLLLGAIANEPELPRPEYLPSVESFLIALHDASLSLETNAILMRHYEQIRDYARAEDALFEMIEAAPANVELLNFGIGFYQRLLRLDDEALELGNLPRDEVNRGLAELNQRKNQR